MRAQLRWLLEMAALPNITIQVLPFTAGAHPNHEGMFVILDPPDPLDPDVVYVENRVGSLFLEEPEDVALYGAVFERLQTLALGERDSRKLISELAEGGS